MFALSQFARLSSLMRLPMAPAGLHSLAGFCSAYLNGELTSGDANRVTAAKPCRDWFQLASTKDGSSTSVLAATPVPVGPIPTQKLNAWVSWIQTAQKARLGIGGPAEPLSRPPLQATLVTTFSLSKTTPRRHSPTSMVTRWLHRCICSATSLRTLPFPRSTPCW